jgi:hypothetical protein
MSIHNRYSNINLTTEDLAAYDAGLASALGIMEELPEVDGLITKHVVKIGMKTEAFSWQALQLARQHPGLLPSAMDLDEVEGDLALRRELRIRYLALIELARRMRGAMIVLGSDGYSGALAAYKAMKTNNRNDALTESLRELGEIFSKRAREKDEDPELPESIDE